MRNIFDLTSDILRKHCFNNPAVTHQSQTRSRILVLLVTIITIGTLAILPATSMAMLPETPPGKLKDPFQDRADTAEPIPDPLEPVNRAMFTVNKIYYAYGVKPVTSGYSRLTSPSLRGKVENFYRNLHEPVTVVNGLLQNKVDDTKTATKRFLINTVFGLGGLFDPAERHHPRVVRGFDQTFAKWGLDHGFYIHWPIVGPSSPRSTGGFILQESMNPFWWSDDHAVTAGGVGLEVVNWSATEGAGYEEMLLRSVDGYTSLKDIFEQTTHNQANR